MLGMQATETNKKEIFLGKSGGISVELGERYELKEEAYFTQAQAFPS